MRYLLDSVILLDHSNGVTAASEFLSAKGGECSVSIMTHAERLAGFDAGSEAAARELPDAIQAAVALEEDLTLVTRNTRDFKDGNPMRVETPYRI